MDPLWLPLLDFTGAHHERDRARRRRLKRLGWDTVETTYADVTTRREATRRELRDLYELRRCAMATGGTLPPACGGIGAPPWH